MRLLVFPAPVLNLPQEFDIDWTEMGAREKLALQRSRLYGMEIFEDAEDLRRAGVQSPSARRLDPFLLTL